jgi:hypothetical protein
VLLIALSAALGAGLTTVAPDLNRRLAHGDSGPAIDSRFVSLGRTYLPELGQAYAAAWDRGAKALDSGQSIDEALKCVGQSWDGARIELFDRLISPELSRIIPDGQPESQVTAAGRQALASAWRGLASGLGSRLGWW